MTSFRSKHYPRSAQPLGVLQEYAMRYYAIFMVVIMAAVLIRLNKDLPVMVIGIGGSIAAVLLANLVAYVKLRRRVAEIFFINDTFTLISVYDILYQVPGKAFPLRFANPTRNQDMIQFHFIDQIVQIKREDWEDEFELIWNWFGQAQVGL